MGDKAPKTYYDFETGRTYEKMPNQMETPSKKTIDKNSTKGTMGEGKNAGSKLYESVKQVVKDSMARTIQTKEQNKENYKKTKIK